MPAGRSAKRPSSIAHRWCADIPTWRANAATSFSRVTRADLSCCETMCGVIRFVYRQPRVRGPLIRMVLKDGPRVALECQWLRQSLPVDGQLDRVGARTDHRARPRSLAR